MKKIVEASVKPKKHRLEGVFEETWMSGTLTIEGVTYEVYLGHMEAHPVRDIGKEFVGFKRKFILIEV